MYPSSPLDFSAKPSRRVALDAGATGDVHDNGVHPQGLRALVHCSCYCTTQAAVGARLTPLQRMKPVPPTAKARGLHGLSL